MDLFKSNNVKYATSIDYNCKCYKSRSHTHDGKILNRFARRKLKYNLNKEVKQCELE